MKIIDRITSWTQRNLKWLIPFVVITPFFLWWWNAHLDAIGYWLWLALHGQKAAELGAGAWVAVGVGLILGALYLAIRDCFGKDKTK